MICLVKYLSYREAFCKSHHSQASRTWVGEENHIMSAWEGPGCGGHKPSSSRSSHTSLLRSLLAKPLQNRYCLMLNLSLLVFFFKIFLKKLPLCCAISSCWQSCLCHWTDQSLSSCTGSISCKCVWKCCLIAWFTFLGQQQAVELIQTCWRVGVNH